jgi:hypothetical protein
MPSSSKKGAPKKRGRPATGKDPLISFRIPEPLILEIDRMAAYDGSGRSATVRRLIELGLAASTSSRPRGPKARAKAADMAAETIDRHTDQAATPEEQASRKRRLLKGPKEFRDIRRITRR